mmetsp:Transcript_19399/g.28725  ORF Transcript_19399/g.28725 Transcript_19399/m.28725 type:complete len:414 (+) Transcript_19399:184-1425(+)
MTESIGRSRDLSLSDNNALGNFQFFEDLLHSKQLVILLDYDGTLTPIVNDPSKALITPEVREVLKSLSKYYTTGIVTGRSLAKIRKFVNVPGLFYAGSHGFDILAPTLRKTCTKNPSVDSLDCSENDSHVNSTRSSSFSTAGIEHERVDSTSDLKNGNNIDDFGARYQVAGEFLPTLQMIRSEASKAVSVIPGAEVEDNIYSISVHYRNCPRECLPQVEEIVFALKDKYEGIRMKNGKEVYELQPDVQWNKGYAVMWMLDMLGLSVKDQNLSPLAEDEHLSNKSIEAIAHNFINRSNIFTIFIGDDKSDEDAFKVFTGDDETNPQQPGIGILVSEFSRPTYATYMLPNPMKVEEFLKQLVQFGKDRNLRPAHSYTNPSFKNGLAYRLTPPRTNSPDLNMEEIEDKMIAGTQKA